MSKQIKKGNIPCNARVDIDYTGKKPKVKFTYPKKNAVRQNLVGIHTYILFVIWLIIYSWGILEQENISNNKLPLPVNCNISINQTNYYSETNSNFNGKPFNFSINNSYLNSIDLNCIYHSMTIEPDYYNNFHTKTNIKILDRLFSIIIVFSALIIILILNWLITKYLVKQQWYKEWLPKHQAWECRKKLKYFKFLPKDLEDNMIIIPRFKNVVLKYDAQGDFSKQLTKLKIRELQYYNFKKGKKVGKIKKDVYTWSAIFFFKEKPKSGYLEVIYF